MPELKPEEWEGQDITRWEILKAEFVVNFIFVLLFKNI